MSSLRGIDFKNTLIIFCVFMLKNIFCEQPKFISDKGDLIFQSAQDKNVTLSLSGGSKFYVNDIDIVESLLKVSARNESFEEIDFKALQNEVPTLVRDIAFLMEELRIVENRTASMPRERIRRLYSRVQTLMNRVNEITVKLRTDECASNPCINGGICYDMYEDFHCECPDTWTGKTCEQDVDECLTLAGTELGCQNKAACVNLPGSYRCNCTNGFSGIHCADRGANCAKSNPEELCGNGVCIPANNNLGYKCICNDGWKIDNITQMCTVDVNECEESIVACHSNCINLIGSFKCGPCPVGYTGDGADCRDINECEQNNGGCSLVPKVQCINTEGSYRCGNCPPGWIGDGRFCSQSDTNLCDTNNICHPMARCEYISGTMVCTCPEGMKGSGYGQLGCRMGSGNPCNEHQCQNGGTCAGHGNSYTCICPEGFDPPFCRTSDPCAQNPCLNGGTCTRHGNTNEFTCSCPREATGNYCQFKRNACGSVIRDKNGTYKYPPNGNLYKENEACAWVIRTDPNLILNVTFSHFDIQPDPDCSKDWLQINDGRSLATPLIGRFCGNELPKGGNILSSQNTLFLWLRTDNSTNFSGFSLSWSSLPPICGGRQEVSAQGQGVLKSPGFPGKSPPNRNCEWEIVAPFGKRFLLRFYEVIMDRSENCTKDSLFIYDTNELLETICESSMPAPKYTSSNIVKLIFHTDPFREDSLFQVHYEVIESQAGCGGLFTEPQGQMMFTMDQKNCRYLIQQPAGMKIFISFIRKSVLAVSSFKIFDGKSEEDPVLFESDKEFLPTNFTSSNNFMLIVVDILDLIPNQKSVLYEADYKRVCSQEFGESSGTVFKTPNYPRPYYLDLDCVYTFVGPLHSVVHLNITDYDISEYPDLEGCPDDADYIEFFNINSGTSERHCKDAPMHIVSSNNILRINFHSNLNPQGRRGIAGSYRFEEIGCGGVLTDTKSSFELLDSTSSRNAYCEWILEAPENHMISLDLWYRRRGTKCAEGETDLKIFLNETRGEGRLAESHCGGEKHILTVLPSRMATVFLKLVPPSLGNAVSYGITANYTFIHSESRCGGNYSILSGSIQSPNWPKEYPDSSDCTWVIHAPLGNKIELVPRNFSLEPSNRACYDDYLEIRNGMSKDSPLIGKYCGLEIPPHIPSFTNHLYLHFHSDSSLPYPGFDITFQQTTTGCGGSLTSHTGSIASPHYPDISRGPIQCDWKITVSQGSTIDSIITKLGPSSNLCSNDVLVIYDGEDSLAKRIPFKCSTEDSVIKLSSSSTNTIFIRYILPEEGALEDQQFYLEYSTNCQQFLDKTEGVIESPNFPENYPNFLSCEWTIVGRKSNTITLSFSHFELEASDLECIYDVFEVIDMKDEETLQTHKLCRSADVLTSDGNKIVVKFTTDFSNSANGFRLEYKRNGCGEYKTRSSGHIDSPAFPYNVDVDCEWKIDVPIGMQIILDIMDIHIEGETENCTSNGLIVKNDKSDATDLLRICNIGSERITVTSHGSSMYVRFYSDSVRARKYFKSYYQTREAQCGGIYRGNQGKIMSPYFPQNYSKNSYCEYMIIGERNSYLHYTLETFEMPLSTNCSNDFLKLFNGLKSDSNNTILNKYCGNENYDIPKTQVAPTNEMTVVFSSGNGPTAKGFMMQYQKACGGSLNAESGTLQSNGDEYCSWKINANNFDSRITITFMFLDCNCEGLSESECKNDRGVRVYFPVLRERFGANSPPTIFCEKHPHDIVISNKYIVTESRNVKFIAKYSTINTACGGTLSSLRGSLASPYYPETYPSNIECKWTVAAESGNYLELNFEQMDIAKSDNCNRDYLEIRETSINGRLLALNCSNVLPKENLQVFEKVWIKFKSSEGSTGNGFKLSWTYAQLNEITGFNGKIKSPPLASLRSENEPFQWRITVVRDNLIWLSFKEYNRGLKLYDGFDSSALPIDIQLSPWEVTSSTNVIFLISDNKMLDQFSIEWKAINKNSITSNDTFQDCNETLSISYGPTVNVSSPGYPSGYENNLNCQWLIKSDHPARHAVLNLYEVQLENIDRCIADVLKIYTSSDLVHWHEELNICDSPPMSRKPMAEIHGTPYIKIIMQTDSTVNGTGFTSLVHTACGGNLTMPIGQILNSDVIDTSTYFPNRIQNCTWHVKVGTARKIQFTFSFPPYTETNSSSECENYAIIRDGIDEVAPILPPGRICSTKDFNGTVVTSTNRATIKYIMKTRNRFLPYDPKLWNVTYREYNECDGEIRLTSYASTVNLTTPNYPNVPNPYTECVWLIIAPPGESIQVDFVDKFDLNVRMCQSEFVEIRDGSTAMAPQIGKYCFRPGTIRSSGNVLYMRYLTDIAEPRNGFKANISISTCGGTFTQYSKVITSANYPAPGGYPANSVCDYVIKVSTFARVNLTFLDVHLPFDPTNLNNSDRIEIYQVIEGAETRVEDRLAVIYGNSSTIPGALIDSNEVLIRFKSFKANSQYRGFKVKYTRNFGACFRDVSGENGVLTLNAAQKGFSMFMLCRWKITVPKGKRVKLDIIDVELPSSNQTSSRNFRVTFYNDFSMLSRITMLSSNNITSYKSISSSDNKMFVRIFGAYTSSLRRLEIAYSSSELSDCPDDITTDKGSLSVKGMNSSSNFYCTFDFILSGIQTISFNVSRMVVEKIDERVTGPAVRFGSTSLIESIRILRNNLTNERVATAVKHGMITLLSNENIQLKQFEATYMKHECGGEFFIENTLEISLPNLTADYGILDCVWHLKSGNPYGLYLTVNFTFTLPCKDEYVSIHAGPTVEYLEIARICKGDTFNKTLLKKEFTYIAYHSNAYSLNSQMVIGFKAATNCGQSIVLEKNEMIFFTSNDYKNNLECVWDIETLDGYYLNIEFNGRFFIEDSKDCVKDYLEVRVFNDGNYVSKPRLCGRNTPPNLNTTSSRVQLIFRSDDAITGDGFSVTIKKSCSAVFNVTNQLQFINYPTRWNLKNVRLECNYILQSDSEELILVRFDKFALGYKSRCSLFQLTANKQTPSGEKIELGPYCKDNAVKELRAFKFISLHYEALVDTGGYEIAFVLDSCGGHVTTPRWIENQKNEEGDGYAHNMNCVWNITAPVNHNIIIQFKYLEMEEHSDCEFDYVSIYRGSQIKDEQNEAKLCGNITTNAPSYNIEGNSAVIVATSDATVSRKGFSARIMFSKVCDDRFTLTRENSPIEIERNLTVGENEVVGCSFRAMAPSGFRLQIELQDLNLNPKNVTCKKDCEGCDYIEVVDSIKGGSLTLAKYCSLGETKPKVFSSFKDAIIRTHFEKRGEHRFKATVQVIESDCGTQSDYIVDNYNVVTISSFNETGHYRSNEHCTWKITSKEEFQLKFTSFSLQNKSDVTGLCLDYVSVNYTKSFSRSGIEDLCGVISSHVIFVEKREDEASAEITFHTDELIESTGFTVQAKITDACNQTHTDISGRIYGVFLKQSECINEILLPEDYTANIIFSTPYFSDSNCSVNFFRVYDKKTNQMLFEQCKENYNGYMKFFSQSNNVRVVLKLLQDSKFDLQYFGSRKSKLAGCGGSINANSILHGLMSPNYQELKNGTICRWNLTTTSPNKIEIMFQEFNMGSICRSDYLNIIEIGDDGRERLARSYCENNNIDTYVSESNRIAIVSVTVADYDGTGWIFEYRSLKNKRIRW